MTELDSTVAHERSGSPAAGPEVTLSLEPDVESPDAPQPLVLDSKSARWRLPLWLRADAPAWTWIGMLIAGSGFGLIAIAWGGVAGETLVYRQMPYVVSAGLVGVTVTFVGLAVLDVASRQQDAVARDRQMEQLIETLEQLGRALGEREDDDQ